MLAKSRHHRGSTPAYHTILLWRAVFSLRPKIKNHWSVGLMDKASASGAGDARFESWADQVGAQEKWQNSGIVSSTRMKPLRVLPRRPLGEQLQNAGRSRHHRG